MSPHSPGGAHSLPGREQPACFRPADIIPGNLEWEEQTKSHELPEPKSQCLRRRPNIKPTLSQRFVFALIMYVCMNVCM